MELWELSKVRSRFIHERKHDLRIFGNVRDNKIKVHDICTVTRQLHFFMVAPRKYYIQVNIFNKEKKNGMTSLNDQVK